MQAVGIAAPAAAGITLRTLLFVPGDSERKLARGLASGADALILDLEDAAAPARKPLAQGMVAEALAARAGDRAPELWVRINLLDAGGLDDLAAVIRAAPAHAGTREPAAAGHAGLDGTSRGATAKRPGQATATPVDG
ncbi:MAG: aldolase/citrate lyase family protein, partial [Janthinobacterium lividum]